MALRAGLDCAGAGDELSRRITRAVPRRGAYLALKDEGVLVVLPQKGLIITAC